MHSGVSSENWDLRLTHYLKASALGSIYLQLSNTKLPELFTSTINFIDEGIIIAQQIQQADYTSSVIEEVCNINIDLYNKELHGVGDESILKALPSSRIPTTKKCSQQVDQRK